MDRSSCALDAPLFESTRGLIGADEITLSHDAERTSARNSFGGRVIAVSGAGALVRVEIDVDGTPLVAVVTAGSARDLALAAGAPIHLAFKATAVRIC